MKAIKPKYIEDLNQEVLHCVECDAPYSRDESWILYNGSTPENLENCIECDKPRFDALGNCPRCGGVVFEFKDNFSCIEQTVGKCDFSLKKEYLDRMDIHPMRIIVGNMLISPETVFFSQKAGGGASYIWEIAFNQSQGWYIKITNLPKEPIGT